jgi:ribosomal protein S27E
MSLIAKITTRFGGSQDIEGAEAVISEQPNAPPTITNQAIVTYCRPWCLACGGWQAIEREYSDGSHRINCRTCGAVLEDRPLFDWPKRKRGEESTVEGV